MPFEEEGQTAQPPMPGNHDGVESLAPHSPIKPSFQERTQTIGARLKGSPFFRTRRRTVVTILLSIPLLLCAGYWLLGMIAFADAAKLIELKGLVQSRKAQESRWNSAAPNQLLRRNEWVRTGESSGACLLFFDVSTVDLDENTEISIEQVAKRRGGGSVDIVLKTWIGKTFVRAVRFVDPSSTLRVETPTASTVVRGARFTVQVEEDGTTQIDLEEGQATVQVGDETVSLTMGERMKLKPSGQYERERIFEPNAQLVIDQVTASWTTPDDTFHLELSENEVNQFLAAMGQQAGFFLQDTQVWFLDDEARIATILTRPTRLDLSAAVSFEVIENQIKPQIHSIAAGVTLPVPGSLLDPAVDLVLDQLDEYLAQAYDLVEFEQVQIKDGYLVVTGRKRPDAPVE